MKWHRETPYWDVYVEHGADSSIVIDLNDVYLIVIEES